MSETDQLVSVDPMDIVISAGCKERNRKAPRDGKNLWQDVKERKAVACLI